MIRPVFHLACVFASALRMSSKKRYFRYADERLRATRNQDDILLLQVQSGSVLQIHQLCLPIDTWEMQYDAVTTVTPESTET